jgi:sarcosine oxidase gamma subunit
MARFDPDHIPALTPLELEAFFARLDQANLSPEGRQEIKRMFSAAANGDAETPAAVIRTLPEERRADIEQTSAAIGSVLNTVGRRGGARLLALSDDEWTALVEEANADA